jgi:hypothetical protein
MNGAQFVAIRDGEGGAIVVGLGGGPDPTTGFDVQAQRIASSGVRWPGWPTSSAFLCTAERNQLAPRAVPDGTGGAVVAWVDQRDTLSNDIYVHRILGSGSIAPGWPVDGLPAVRGVPIEAEMTLIEDSQGGAFLIWVAGYSTLRALHVVPEGVLDPAWPEDGLLLCDAPGQRSYPRGVLDGMGAAYVVWQDYARVSGPPWGYDLYAQRFSAAGAIAPGWSPNGVAVSLAPGSQSVETVSLDASGDLFVSWGDQRSGNLDPYALRVRANGTTAPGWTPDGSPALIHPAYQYSPIITPDGSGGAFVIWSDFRGPDFDVYGQHLLADGQPDPAWPTPGLGICTAPTFQYPTCVADGAGGLYVCWLDNRNYDVQQGDIYATHIGSNGQPIGDWPSDGLPICDTPHDQSRPQLIESLGGAIALWTEPGKDRRGGLWAMRIVADGVVAVEPSAPRMPGFSLSAPRPNPSHGALTFHVELSVPGMARLDLVDAAGRRVRSQAVPAEAGWHAVAVDASSLRPGVYRARLVQGTRSTAVSVTIVR